MTALRLMAPIVVLSTVGVFATGVVLLLEGPSSRGRLAAAAQGDVHRLDRVHRRSTSSRTSPRCRACCARATAARASAGRDVNGRAGRMMSLAGATVLGTVLAILLIPQFSPWLDSVRFLSGH